MVDLVTIENGVVWTDSKKIADKFKKPHKRVLESIDKLDEDIKNLMAENTATKKDEYIFKEEKRIVRGREFRSFGMNRNAFSILAMGFTGKKALKWKVDFIKAFNIMEDVLKNKTNPDVIQLRSEGKKVRLESTNCISEFVEYCFSQGSTNAKRYFGTITKMEYVALQFLGQKEKVPSQFRDTLDKMEVFMLLMAEHVADETIKQGMNEGLHYKEIFLLAKQAVLKYSESVIFKRLD